jgi:benzylsuccinate CoA-transferase BbsF subunit
VGWPDRPPAGPFGAYTDYLSPRISLATLIAALDHRRRTGEGQYIDFAQGEGALHFLAPVLLEAEATGRDPERQGNDDADLAPHGVYRAAGDDCWVAIACATDEQWGRLAGHLGRADLGGLNRSERWARRRDLDRLIEGWTSGRPGPAVQDELQAIGVPAHAVQNSPECRVDPQLAALGHFAPTEHAELGPVEVEASRIFLRSTPPRVAAAPTIGQHVVDVLEGILGYGPDRVSELLISRALE